MARIHWRTKKEITVPFGVDAISDGATDIQPTEPQMLIFVEVRSRVCMLRWLYNNNDISKSLRRKTELHLANLKVLYFINPESDKNLDTRELTEIAKSTVFKTGADGLCISACKRQGKMLMKLYFNLLRMHVQVLPCQQIQDVDLETIESKLKYADAAVVGTYFKLDGKLQGCNGNNLRVDVNRVKSLMLFIESESDNEDL